MGAPEFLGIVFTLYGVFRDTKINLKVDYLVTEALLPYGAKNEYFPTSMPIERSIESLDGVRRSVFEKISARFACIA